jgi:chromosome partitioning protein
VGFEPLEERFDVIVVDTPPAESYLTVSALAACDEVLIPLEAHFLAMQGLSQALAQIDQVCRGLNPKLRITGILPTKVNARTNISRIVLDEAKNAYPDLLYPFTSISASSTSKLPRRPTHRPLRQEPSWRSRVYAASREVHMSKTDLQNMMSKRTPSCSDKR